MNVTNEVISKTVYSLLEPLSLQRTCQVITDNACMLTTWDDSFICLNNQGTETMKLANSTNPTLPSVPFKKRGDIYRSLQKRELVRLTDSTLKAEFSLIHQLAYTDMVLVPLFYNKTLFGVVSILSRTKQTKQPAMLNLLTLFGALASLAIRKAELYDQKDCALEDRDFFISVASHELKTPLTSMHGYIQLLHTKLANDPQYADWITKLYKESMKITRMVEELFDMHKIKIDKIEYHFEPHPLQHIVDEAVKRFKRMFPRHMVSVSDERSSQNDIVADYERLIQVITNILENSAKFSHPEEPIAVRLTCKKNTYVIAVEDKGRGMTEEEQTRALNGFYKGMTDEQKEGLGIGLFLAKTIVTNHKGILGIQSTKNVGTTVTVELPSLRA